MIWLHRVAAVAFESHYPKKSMLWQSNALSDDALSAFPMQQINYCVAVTGRAILELSWDIT